MSKFAPYEVSQSGSSRIRYEKAMFPMGTYTTGWLFETVTFRYGTLPLVFSACDFERVVFDRIDMKHVVFLNCKFEKCEFKGCDLRYATFIDCTGHGLTFRRCEAAHLLFMHSMVDGTNFVQCALQYLRITVNTEYLAPLKFIRCLLDNAFIVNLANMQYDGIFGKPKRGPRDRASVKTDRCSGVYEIQGFHHACQR